MIFSNDYYGGLWATFNFDGLQKWIEDSKAVNKCADSDIDVCADVNIQAGEKFLKSTNEYSTVENIEETWLILK